MLFQLSAVAAALTDAVCLLLLAVFAGSACTGAAGKGAAITNLIQWIHFLSHFYLIRGLGEGYPLRVYVAFSAIFQWVFSEVGLFQ